MNVLINTVITNEFFVLFLVIALGLLIGKIRIKNICLETSGALFVGLIFGAYGFRVNNILFNFGLVLFVSAVGLLAAKDVGRVIKLYGFKFAILGIVITFGGALATYLITLMYKGSLDPYLVSGTYTGALTSSPGLAAAIEATNNNPMISIGHAVAYPMGVVIVILFVQLVPHIFKIDIKNELELYKTEMRTSEDALSSGKELFNLVSLSMVIIIGAIIGTIPIPIPFISKITLGTTGGILISALLFGYRGSICGISTRMPKAVLLALKELGLAIFLAIVGLDSGAEVIGIVQQYGFILIIIALVGGLTSQLFGFILGRYIWKMNWILLSGAICGGMTSTPGLGAAIDATGSDEVAAGYGATYPFALLFMVIWTIILHKIA